jgi:hypothetical protein
MVLIKGGSRIFVAMGNQNSADLEVAKTGSDMEIRI